MAQYNTDYTRLAPNYLENRGNKHRRQGIKSYTEVHQVGRGHIKDTRPKPVTPGIKQPVMSSLHCAMEATLATQSRTGATSSRLPRVKIAPGLNRACRQPNRKSKWENHAKQLRI